jgi:hypothetical protein
MGFQAVSAEPQGALPLPDFDHLPVESLAVRVQSLDIQQLEQLIGYERNHSGRGRVLDLLEHRRDQLDPFQ